MSGHNRVGGEELASSDVQTVVHVMVESVCDVSNGNWGSKTTWFWTPIRPQVVTPLRMKLSHQLLEAFCPPLVSGEARRPAVAGNEFVTSDRHKESNRYQAL